MTIRRTILFVMVLSFLVLGTIDLYEGRLRTGVAGWLLGVVQMLLFL